MISHLTPCADTLDDARAIARDRAKRGRLPWEIRRDYATSRFLVVPFERYGSGWRPDSGYSSLGSFIERIDP